LKIFCLSPACGRQCCQLKSREKRIDKMNLKMRKYVKGEKLSKT